MARGQISRIATNPSLLAKERKSNFLGHIKELAKYTSRFMGRTKGNREEAGRVGRAIVERQTGWLGVRYHEIWMGKPRYEFVIDDRSVFYDPTSASIEAFLEERRSAHPE